MTSPTEHQELFNVVVNAEGQHALWPSFAAIPAGWAAVFGVTARQECLDYVEANWTDIRPKSLIATLDGEHAQ
jgi:MbtH protein